jgi:hypothetical protein
VKGKTLIAKGRYTTTEEFPPKDYQFDVSFVLHLDFETSHYRNETEGEVFDGSEGKFCPIYRVQTFDGNTFKSFLPREKNTGNGYAPSARQPDLFLGGTDLANYPGPFFEAEQFPVLFAAGMVDSYPDPRKKSTMREPLKPNQLSFQGYAVQDERRCVVLRQPIANLGGAYIEMWVDLEQHAAVRRWIMHLRDFDRHDIRVTYKARTDDYVPTAWTITNYQRKDRLNNSSEYQLESFTINAPVEDEDLNLERKAKPGMVVEKYTGEGDNVSGQLYKVQSDGSLSPLQPDANSDRNWLKVALWVSAALLFAAATVVLARRLFTRAPSVNK